MAAVCTYPGFWDGAYRVHGDDGYQNSGLPMRPNDRVYILISSALQIDSSGCDIVLSLPRSPLKALRRVYLSLASKDTEVNRQHGRLDKSIQLVCVLPVLHLDITNIIRYISLVAASCMVLYGYDASVFNALQNSKNWVAYYNNPQPNIIGAINTSYTVGAVVAGFFMGGPLADFAGRRVGMAAGAVLVIIATFMQTFAPHGKIGVFIAGRVLIGMGQGLALTAGSIYIGELSPPEIRGKIMSFWQMFYSVGSFIAYWVSFATSKHPKGLGEWDWKMVVIFQLLVPILILSQVFFIPESPR